MSRASPARVVGSSRSLISADRQVRAVERWARSLDGEFPAARPGNSHDDWKLPVAGALVNPPTTTAQIQIRIAHALLDGAARLRAARPAEQDRVRVMAMISLPDMFPSRILVFHDPAYFASFAVRTGRYQQWTPLGRERSLVREWGLVLPERFVEQGFREVIFYEDDDNAEQLVEVHDREVWLVVDVAPDRV